MSNIDTARSAYEAFRSGDLAALKEFYTDEAVWYFSEEAQPGVEVHGRDAIIDTFARIPDWWTMAIIEPTEYIDFGVYVVISGTQRFAKDNGSEESPFVNVLTFDRDGKVVRGEFHADTAKMPKLQGWTASVLKGRAVADLPVKVRVRLAGSTPTTLVS
jgi:ketosteroid isomerase-like protein